MVEKAKSRHFQHTINNNSNDPKQLWKGVNLIRGKGSKTTNITSLEVEEETVTGDKNIALNSSFVNVGPSLSKELPEVKTLMLITCNILHKLPLPLTRLMKMTPLGCFVA